MFIQVITPREREPDQNFDKKSHYATTTDFKRFRKTAVGELEAPIKASFNQPTYNHFDQLTIHENAGIKKKTPFGIDFYNVGKFGEKN